MDVLQDGVVPAPVTLHSDRNAAKSGGMYGAVIAPDDTE